MKSYPMAHGLNLLKPDEEFKMSFSLAIAKYCLDCETIFAGGNEHCIACGSTQWVFLAKYFKTLKGDRHEHIENDIHSADSGVRGDSV